MAFMGRGGFPTINNDSDDNEQNDEIKAKRYNMCAIASIGWILIYDIIVFFASIEEMAFIGYDYFLGEILTIVYLFTLALINKDLAKADNPERYKESTDWFYEKYDENEQTKK